MTLLQFAITLLILCSTIVDTTQWALLVSGSKGWENYRHQANVLHVHQILRENDFPMEQVITMVYDDIAFHKNNPYPGKVFNDYTLKDVYKGAMIDYKGDAVNSSTLLRVMNGDKSLGNKTLNTGENDELFMYFSIHGIRNKLEFSSDKLSAGDLISTLNDMHKRKRYRNMLIFIEACYSASIFEGLLPNNTKVYALTAANSTQYSYAALCDRRNKVNVCLSDEFSHEWMGIVQQTDLHRLTVEQLRIKVKNNVNRSTVMNYGDPSVGKLSVAEFIGSRKESSNQTGPALRSRLNSRDIMRQRHTPKGRQSRLTELDGKLHV